MLLSLFTPTHNPRYIFNVFGSLTNQNPNIPWQWVIVLNNGLTKEDLPIVVREQRNVIVQTTELTGIGALKKFACSLCTGELLIEMDHDDLLPASTFDDLVKAYNKEPNGFYYSDFINHRPNNTCQTYSMLHGWQSYNATVDGKNYKAVKAFEPSARSICELLYAPNHIRAWSRETYDKAGGHDETLAAGDDHDLVCRTYLTRMPFVYIPKPLYIYNLHGQNTIFTAQKDIQETQQRSKNKYIYQLIFEECRRKDLLVLDSLASKPKDKTVGLFTATNVLDELPNDKRIGFLNDVYRALAPGGWLLTKTTTWAEDNFKYLTDRKFKQLMPESICRFQLVRSFLEDGILCADLCALKGQRQAGLSNV